MFQNCIENPAQVENDRKFIENRTLQVYEVNKDKNAKYAFEETVLELKHLVSEGFLPKTFRPTSSRVRSILVKHKVYRPYGKISTGKPIAKFNQITNILTGLVGDEIFYDFSKTVRNMPYIQQLKFWITFLKLQGFFDEAENLQTIVDKVITGKYILRY